MVARQEAIEASPRPAPTDAELAQRAWEFNVQWNSPSMRASYVGYYARHIGDEELHSLTEDLLDEKGGKTDVMTNVERRLATAQGKHRVILLGILQQGELPEDIRIFAGNELDREAQMRESELGTSY